MPASTYGKHLGLPTRYAVYQRRNRLAAKRSPKPTPSVSDALRKWLSDNRSGLREVAAALVDNRDDLLMMVSGIEQQDELAQAIDQAGARLSARPSSALARSIAYAMYLLRPAGLTHQPLSVEVQELLNRGALLRSGFLAAQPAD